MKSLLEKIETVDIIIRALNKISSKMNSGQFIGAYGEVGRLIAFAERIKRDIVEQEEKSKNV